MALKVCKECEITFNSEYPHKCWFKKCECGHDRDFHAIWTHGKCNMQNCNCKGFN